MTYFVIAIKAAVISFLWFFLSLALQARADNLGFEKLRTAFALLTALAVTTFVAAVTAAIVFA